MVDHAGYHLFFTGDATHITNNGGKDMFTNKTTRASRLSIVAICAAFFITGIAWGHGDGTSIVPKSLTAKAGSGLEVTVSGLVGTKTATFQLTGMLGKYDLGTFPIKSDDFTQMLQIPSDVPPGSYRLSVEGGGKNAKVVITIN
jgi:hypothetical protein